MPGALGSQCAALKDEDDSHLNSPEILQPPRHRLLSLYLSKGCKALSSSRNFWFTQRCSSPSWQAEVHEPPPGCPEFHTSVFLSHVLLHIPTYLSLPGRSHLRGGVTLPGTREARGDLGSPLPREEPAGHSVLRGPLPCSPHVSAAGRQGLCYVSSSSQTLEPRKWSNLC